jgi:hypothetical protein
LASNPSSNIWYPGKLGFHWFSQHRAVGNREIFIVMFGEDNRLREGGPLIEGAVWESPRHMREFYERFYRGTAAEDASRGGGAMVERADAGDHQRAPGFVRWCHSGGDEGFASWEEANIWVEKRERD